MRHIRPLLTVLIAGELIPAIAQLPTASASVAQPTFRCIGTGCGGGGSDGGGGNDPPAPQCSPDFIGNSNTNDNWTVTGINDVMTAGADGSA